MKQQINQEDNITSHQSPIIGHRSDSGIFKNDYYTCNIAAQDVEPWMNISNGNPIYARGGGIRLGADMPKAPENQWSKSGSVYEFKNIPVYDSPVLIAEKTLLKISKPASNLNEN